MFALSVMTNRQLPQTDPVAPLATTAAVLLRQAYAIGPDNLFKFGVK
jgi:hypothetical protein